MSATEQTATGTGHLVARLQARLPELTERVVTQILDEEPGYHEASGISRDELSTSVQQNLAQLIDKLGDPGAETLRFLGFLSEMGRRRVEQGLPLDSLLHAFRIGARTIWQGLREEAEHLDAANSAGLVEAATAIWELHEAVSSRVSAAYRDAELALLRRREREHSALLDGLLAGRGQEPAFAREAAFALRLRLDGRYVVIVTESARDSGPASGDLGPVLSGRGFAAVWRTGSPHGLGVVDLGDADVHTLQDALEREAEGRVGVSTVVGSLGELPKALQLAEIALASLPEGSRGVAVLAERLPAALLAASPEIAGVLVEQMLGPLFQIHEAERMLLLNTLDAYAETGGSATDTAQRIYCHRNTVVKRLRRFEDLTGHRLAEPQTLLAVGLAVKAVPLVLTS